MGLDGWESGSKCFRSIWHTRRNVVIEHAWLKKLSFNLEWIFKETLDVWWLWIRL